MHNINQETDQYDKEDDIYMVNINSINFNSKHSVITANFKASSNQAIIVILCKVGRSSNRHIMPLYILKKMYSLGPQKNNEQEMKTSI